MRSRRYSNKNRLQIKKLIMDLPLPTIPQAPLKRFQLKKHLKLSRNQTAQTKLDKKSSGRPHEPQPYEEMEIEKAFKIHSRKYIGKCQAIFSLKILGYQCKNQQDIAKFSKIWPKFGKEYIDEQNFKALALQLKSKGEMKDNNQVFNIMAQEKSVLDRPRLEAISKQVGRKVDGLIQACGKDGVITFNQFDSSLKFINTFM